MPYDPNAINFRFVDGNSSISRLIKWQTWGPWSHVEFVVPNGYLGALWDGVKVRPVGYDKGKYNAEMFLKLPLPPDQLKKANDFMWAQEGKKYDWRGDLGFISRANWTMVNRWFCARYGYAVPAVGGVEVLRITADYRISPTLLSTSKLLIEH